LRTWVLLYDGDCAFCRRQVGFIERHDAEGRIEAVPFQEADLGDYGVTRQAAADAMHLVSPAGDVWSGAAAAREVLKLLRWLRPLAWLFYLPGAMFVAERVYRWIARRRHRFGCGSAVCRRGGDG
jgi:predicted DCC family thiol-disulfide oxidoreductase YuxK